MSNIPAGSWAVAAVAERVGVSVSTLRSWERRYGLHPNGRTNGGHRRYTAADVATLQRMNRLISAGMPTSAAAAAVQPQSGPQSQCASAPARTGDTDSRLQLSDAAARLDAPDAARIAARVLKQRGAVRAWTEVFTPVLQELGHCWQETGDGVHREHLITGTIQTALDRYAARRTTPRAPVGRVLLSATPTEGHTLPLHATAAALAERGIASDVFGTLPRDALRAAIEQSAPSAVLVFSRSRSTAEVRMLRPLTRLVPLLCAAGIGWPPRLPATVAAARDLASTVDLLQDATG